MVETALTTEQQRFAEDNHNLVYAFLNDKKLQDEDFYDIVVFGYLKAVKEYSTNFALSNKYKFSTISYKYMRSEVCRHYDYLNRQKRSGFSVSLDSLIYGDGEALHLHEVLSAPDSHVIDFQTELIMLELASRVSKRDMDVIRMKADGCGVREISKAQNMPMKGVKELLAGLRETVHTACYE